jgi:hypothetical protein
MLGFGDTFFLVAATVSLAVRAACRMGGPARER